jgi:hypothetical protein
MTITLWNTVYMERALVALRADRSIEDNWVAHLLPLSWEHIHLTGDYVWRPGLSFESTEMGQPRYQQGTRIGLSESSRDSTIQFRE